MLHIGLAYRVPTSSLSKEPGRKVRASGVVTHSHVVQRIRSGRVQPRVQEAQRRLRGCQEPVIEQRDDARERRRRRARATDVVDLAVDDNLEVLREPGDVWVPAPGFVVEAVVCPVERVDEPAYGGILVCGPRPVVGEATAGEEHSRLWYVLSASDGNDASVGSW